MYITLTIYNNKTKPCIQYEAQYNNSLQQEFKNKL